MTSGEIDYIIYLIKDIRNCGTIKNNFKEIDKFNGMQGFYIFYREKNEEQKKPKRILYVGESHKVSGNWGLGKRLKQHFRLRDSGGILYKIAKKRNINISTVRNDFINKDTKLLVLTFKNQAPRTKKEILNIEGIMIGILNPIYNY